LFCVFVIYKQRGGDRLYSPVRSHIYLVARRRTLYILPRNAAGTAIFQLAAPAVRWAPGLLGAARHGRQSGHDWAAAASCPPPATPQPPPTPHPHLNPSPYISTIPRRRGGEEPRRPAGSWVGARGGCGVELSVVGRDWSPVSSNKARGYCCRTPGDH
jgi:hypothetical protein